MKKFWWLFALLCLTAPKGQTIYVVKDQIVAVLPFHTDYSETQIDLTSGKSYYVKETPEQVAEKLQ